MGQTLLVLGKIFSQWLLFLFSCIVLHTHSSPPLTDTEHRIPFSHSLEINYVTRYEEINISLQNDFKTLKYRHRFAGSWKHITSWKSRLGKVRGNESNTLTPWFIPRKLLVWWQGVGSGCLPTLSMTVSSWQRYETADMK